MPPADRPQEPESLADKLRAAILDIDAHATPLGRDEDGFVTTGYLVSVGSLHRALGLVGHSSAKCVDLPCERARVACQERDTLRRECEFLFSEAQDQRLGATGFRFEAALRLGAVLREVPANPPTELS